MKTLKNKNEIAEIKKKKCNFCNKIIIGNSYKYKSHLYQHNAVKPRFKCSYCSKEYFRRDAFEKHIVIHTGKTSKQPCKHHICDYCGRGFVDKRNLISHLRVHDDYFNPHKRQFKCMACGLCYCEERLLKYHIRKQHYNLHAKETTYDKKKPNETWVERVMQSEICVEITKIGDNTITIKKSPTVKIPVHNKDKEKSIFKDYMTSVFASTDKSHYSKAICDYCNKEMLKKSLISHIRERHLQLKRFKCEICKESFNRHYQMVNHKCGKVIKRKRRTTAVVPVM